MKQFSPKRRRQGIRVEEFQNEVLVYDLDRHDAHCLNSVAVSVWQLADGTLSVEEIAGRLAAAGAEPDETVVWRALEELEKASLLETPLPTDDATLSRRQMVGKLGWAAALPFVLSIAVPKPAFAQTGGTLT
jgi:hypothetical protein